MVATTATSSTMSGTEVRVIQRTRRYRWPAIQLNFWLLIMLIGSATILGVFASFITVQNQLEVGIPWYFAYWIAVSAITIIHIFLLLYLISNQTLLPGIVLLGSFILFVLWLVGLIVISIELWGPSGVNNNCQVYVNNMPFSGKSIETLAWLQQRSICQAWTAAWSFMLVGVVFLLWAGIISWQVYRDD